MIMHCHPGGILIIGARGHLLALVKTVGHYNVKREGG